MKLKLLAGAALAGVFAAASASADPAPSGWYGAIDLGAHIQNDTNTRGEFSELGGPPADLTFREGTNFAGFARVGYKISPHFRVELEGGWRTSELQTLTERFLSGRPAGSISAVCSAQTVPS